MKIDLYQVYYGDKQPLDSGCIPVNTKGIDVWPLFENKIILDTYPKFANADYYGVTSWRMFEKTGLTHEKISSFVEENPGHNVYIYGSYDSEYALLQNLKTSSQIGLAWKRLFELNTLDIKNEEGWINCFCNYFIADKKTWDRYILYLTKAVKAINEDPILKWIFDNTTFKHRNENYPLHPFVLEYLIGLFLKENKDITYAIIPNNLKNMHTQKRAYNPAMANKSLLEIYDSHKTSGAGLGDKGTLHHYIENYDMLFTPYRYKRINILEIGVQEGYSLRMWRDYFPLANIVGMDIKMPSMSTPGCDVYICDQNNPKQIDEVLKDMKFDIIIDDGSHLLEHQITSHKALFNRLNDGGIYVIEDIQNPESDIPVIIQECGKCDIYDTREISNRYDDILLVWKKQL